MQINPVLSRRVLGAVLLVAAASLPTARIASAHPAAAKLAPNEISATVYKCPKGDYESMKAGKCPTDRLVLRKTSVIRTYKCETCGMTYNHAGTCAMDGSKLAAYDVSYTCPKDQKAVAHGGACPRCPADALQHMTKVNAKAPTRS